jgi:serine/threonine protein kinase
MTTAPRRDPYRLIGETFGARYRLEEFAGAGSFGAVYRATDTRLGRTVAVKILKPDIKEEDAAGARELFQREALTAGQLVHPNIVAVTDTGEEFGFAYLIMEWLEGRTLEDELHARAPLSPAETASLLAGIADALQTAHDAGVIHRDIKPSNIHLGRHGRTHVKVLDFGIAKVVKTSTAAAASRVAGTLSYMSPEQLGSEPIDRRADIYSLGIMLYQMLTGTLPFTGESQGQIVHQHFVEPPPPLSRVRPDLPGALSNVIERALAKRREMRQSTAQELYEEFTAALGQVSSQTLPLDSKGSGYMPVPTPAQTSAPAPGAQTVADPLLQAATSPYLPTMVAPPATAPMPMRATSPALAPANTVQTERQTIAGDLGQLRSVRNFAFIFALVFLLLSVGVALLARWMEWIREPYPYDEFVLALIPIALRDTVFGALLGASLSELKPRRRRKGAEPIAAESPRRWSIAGSHWAKSLIVHGATGAALLMLPFVILRTSLFLLPMALAVAGFIVGAVICGIRIAVQRITTAK